MKLSKILVSTVIAVPATLALYGADQTWSQKMQQLSQILPELLVDVSKKSNFEDKKKLKRIKQNTKKLADLSHNVVKAQKTGKGGPIDKDPSIGILSEIFEDEAAHAQAALDRGNYDYARAVLLSVSSYCTSCHTRSEFGPKYPIMPFKADTSSLTNMEKADLFSATRQFDRAIASYQKVIKDKKVMEADPFTWQKAVKRAVALSVRVNQDPDKAIEILMNVPKMTRAAFFLESRVDLWIKSLRAWKKEGEPKRKKSDPLFHAKHLIEMAQLRQKFPADESGAIYYLRASAELHNLLRQKLTAPQLAEAFYLTGLAYEGIDVLKVWSLPEVYYQSCIKSLPHSKTAEQCFKRFEENIYMGYSGSGGTQIPEDVQWKLNELRGKSSRKKGKGSK